MPDGVHGRHTKVLANGVDLSRYLTEASMSGGYDQTESTTFGQGTQSFVTGLRNGGEGSIGGNVEEPGEKVLRRFLRDAGGRDDNILSLSFGDEVGALGVGARCGLSTQEFSSAPADLTTVSIGVQGNRGVDDLVMLHALTEESVTGDGAAYDDEDQSANGGIGYLHVTEIAGGTLDVIIEHSPDGATWAELLAFGQVAALAGRTAERKVVLDVPVDAQVRASWTLAVGGTARFAVQFARGKQGEDVS